MKSELLSILIVVSLSFGILSCNRITNNIQPIGTYCGRSDQEFVNPLSFEALDQEVFSELSSVPNKKYRASTINFFFKNPSAPEEQMMFVHRNIFLEDQIFTESFAKTCSRKLTLESKGSFETTLPVEMTLNSNMTWSASKSITYNVDYGPEFPSFLVNTATVTSEDVAPSDTNEFDFSEYIFLEQIGKLDKAQKKMKLDPLTALNQIYLQAKVSDSPEIYVRVFLTIVPETN